MKFDNWRWLFVKSFQKLHAIDWLRGPCTHHQQGTRSVDKWPIHYWTQALCRVPNALGKGYFALSKAFVEGSTRQRASGKKSVGKEFFVERLLSGTRQSLRRVQSRHSAKKSDRHGAGCVSTCFAECHVRGARQRFFNFFFKISLPSALPGRHSANIFFNNFFAECPARSALGKYFLIFFS